MKKSKITSLAFWASKIGILSIVLLLGCVGTEEQALNSKKELINLNYGDDPRQVMDVYLPAGRSTESTPLLIYIHGGAWIDGDKSEFLQVKSLAENSLSNFAFVSINYRLYDFISGSNQFPTQENDIASAINFIENNLTEWNVSNNLILSGASAGAHLALLQAYKAPVNKFEAVIAFFPPTDLNTLFGFSVFTAQGLSAILGGSPDQNPNLYISSSPSNFVTRTSPPTILFHGELDTVVPIIQSELLANLLAESEVRHELFRVPNQGHGFSPETYEMAFEQIKNFLNQ